MLRQAERWKLQDIPFTQIAGDLTMRGAEVQGPVNLGTSLSIGQDSRIIGPVAIGSGTTIGEKVLIGPYTSIGENCTIRNNAKIFSSSVYNGVVIGEHTTVSGSIVDNHCVIGESCSLENDTVIGPRAVLHERVIVHSRTRIWPEVVVPEGTVVTEYYLNEKYQANCGGS